MLPARSENLGIANIGIIIAVALISVTTILVVIPPSKVRENIQSVIEIATSKLFPSPTIEPAPSPTPIATPTPTVTPTPTSTPSPSPTPPPAPPPTPTQKPVSGPPSSGHSRITVSTERGSYYIDVVSIDMSAGVRMITDTASENDCSDNCPVLPLSEYVARNGGFAGMNGTYFCPSDYGECSSKKNSFDFPVYSSRLNKWINGGNLFWNNRSMIYFDGSGMHFMRNANSFGGGLLAGIVNHPALLEGGNVIADHFPLSDKQRAKGTKSGIGIRGSVIYLVIARGVDMLDLAHVFKTLGADRALNLDGGGSVALWFGGYKVGPGRSLPNAIIFTR